MLCCVACARYTPFILQLELDPSRAQLTPRLSSTSYHRYAVKDFCFKSGISPDQLKERLKIFDASLAAVQVSAIARIYAAGNMPLVFFSQSYAVFFDLLSLFLSSTTSVLFRLHRYSLTTSTHLTSSSLNHPVAFQCISFFSTGCGLRQVAPLHPEPLQDFE